MSKNATASRLGASLTVLALLAIDLLLPRRYQLAPDWLVPLAVFIMLASMAAVTLARGSVLWRRVERVALTIGIAGALVFNGLNLLDVIDELLHHPRGVQPLPLIETSIGLWAVNMLVFTMLYWLIDRGGPDARARGSTAYPDFDFPAMKDPSKVPPGWQPGFIDYLFIGFTTTAAFGPTEAMPLTQRAKALMIVQSLVSVVTIVVVAARAIGVLS